LPVATQEDEEEEVDYASVEYLNHKFIKSRGGLCRFHILNFIHQKVGNTQYTVHNMDN